MKGVLATSKHPRNYVSTSDANSDEDSGEFDCKAKQLLENKQPGHSPAPNNTLCFPFWNLLKRPIPKNDQNAGT